MEDLEGYLRDAQGRLVPLNLVKPLDALRDELVKKLIRRAEEEQARLALFKSECMKEVEDFLSVSAGEYQVKWGGVRGNVCLRTFDGKQAVKLHKADLIFLDEKIQLAKEQVDICLNKWSQGADEKIRTVILDAFQVDKEGKVNRARILGLTHLAITDPDWVKAMRLIRDSVHVRETKDYLRFYNNEAQISLDFSSV